MPHQAAEFQASRDRAHWGLFWEMGTGKTCETVMQMAHLQETGAIDAALILAPSGVHRNWVTDEFPKHLPEALGELAGIHLWNTSKAGTKTHAASAAHALSSRFPIAVMSYDAMMTDLGRAYSKALLTKKRCLYVLDESPKIKTPGAKRTIRIQSSARYAPFRRILTGTLVADKPFDVYSQLRWLNPEAWKSIGCDDFSAFKATFGVWQKRSITTGGMTREFPMLVAHRNLDLMREIVAAHGSRLLKENVLDLPPKLYSRRYFDLSPKQRKLYQELRENFFAEIQPGTLLTADLAITRILRFQQITAGYLPSDDDSTLVPIIEPNPRLGVLRDVIDECNHQVIIWAKYRKDVQDITEMLQAEGRTSVKYYGGQDEDANGDAKDAFCRGDAQFFVATPQKGAEGLTLTCAKTMVYYNVAYSLNLRQQSEDRFHRIGQDVPVNIVDLVASDTVDGVILDALRRKYEWSATVQGDEIRKWL